MADDTPGMSEPTAESDKICGEKHWQGITCVRDPHQDDEHRNGVARWVSTPPAGGKDRG